MAINDLAPGFIKLFYNSNGHNHVDTIPIRPSGTPVPGTMPNVLDAGDNVVTALVGLTAYITAIKALYHTSASFVGYEVYTKAIGFDPLFVFGDDLNIAGTSAVAAVPDGEVVITFRTAQGGVAKFYAMEGSTATNVRTAARTGAAGIVGTLTTFFLGATNIRMGRDTAKIISGIYFTSKINDALRKKRVLDA